MIANFLRITLRSMLRNRLSTAVNIVGLSLGVSGTLLIASLLRFEEGYNRVYPKLDRLFMVMTDEYPEGLLSQSSASPGPMAEFLTGAVPEVERAVLVMVDQEGLITVRTGGVEKKFHEETGLVRTPPEFFDMFDIRWISGDPQSLAAPNTVALSRSIAEKLFGDEEPIGRTIRLHNAIDLTVVGVVPDPPVETDLAFTVYRSAADLRERDAWAFEWTNFSTNVATFVQLRPGADAAEIERRLPALTEQFYRQSVDKKIFRLKPVADMHYEPDYASFYRAVDPKVLGALALIGVFLILTASINFVNMATAQAVVRSREVGVRKVLGASPRAIAVQFLGETFVVVFISTLFSLGAAELLMPLLAEKLDIPVAFDAFDPATLAIAAGLALLTTALAGIYPALVISGFAPSVALKGKTTSGGLTLRRGLVVFQFAISQLLIVGTLVVTLQMSYIVNRDMGFDGEGVVTVPLPMNDPLRLETLRSELLADPDVVSVSYNYNGTISGSMWDTNLRWLDGGEEKYIRTALKFADPDYFTTYGLTIVAGRAPHPADTIREFVVNEAFVGKLGLASPAEVIGKTFRLGGRPPMPVVGVVRNFNSQSLQFEIVPCLIAPRVSAYQEAAIRIRAGEVAGTMKGIERAWSAAFPEYLFDSEFLDERIEELYEQERRVEFLFRVFASTAILIGCIGLFGLVSFVAARKTKEIGIRKVLGASAASIVGLFSKEFARLILIAFCAAAPAGYFAMDAWLQDYAYRISIGPGIFLGALGAIVVITAITIGFRALRAAAANPVESLRYE